MACEKFLGLKQELEILLTSIILRKMYEEMIRSNQFLSFFFLLAFLKRWGFWSGWIFPGIEWEIQKTEAQAYCLPFTEA